jgi:Hemerythrin HHE cation binding domain
VIPNEGPSCARIPELLGHDHSELDELLDRFFAAAKKRDLDESFNALDVFWARLAMHIRAEHLHLFPTLIVAVGRFEKTKENVCCPPSAQVARDTIARLREDHDFFMQELTAAITKLRKERDRGEQSGSTVLSDVRKKAVAVSRRLQTHNALEESEVYRWAEALLEDAECTELNTRMNRELEKLPKRLLP